MRYSLLFTLLVTFCSFAQTHKTENDSLLIWNKNRQITWEDFLSKDFTIIKNHAGSKATNTVNGAAITTSLNFYPIELNCKNHRSVIIAAVMDKKKSCVIFKRDEILNHEQTHFDIAELYARKIRKKLENILENGNECNLQAIADAYYKLEDEFWETQFLYDKEVRIEGEEYLNQRKWDMKIDSLLNVYKEYERDIYIEDLELE